MRIFLEFSPWSILLESCWKCKNRWIHYWTKNKARLSFDKPKHSLYQGLILYIFSLRSAANSRRCATKNSNFDVTFCLISPYFSLLNFERGLKKNYGLPNLETLCSYYSLLETATVLILCKNIDSFLRYDCSKWDMLFSQR